MDKHELSIDELSAVCGGDAPLTAALTGPYAAVSKLAESCSVIDKAIQIAGGGRRPK